MTSYVDVDTSEEALQEDVELQEAVEQIVQKGAEIIIEDVRKDVNGVYEKSKALLLGAFPFVVSWSEDHNKFREDMEHLAIAGLLFGAFFWFLAPWGDPKGARQRSSSGRTGRSGRAASGRQQSQQQRSSMERSKSMSSIKRRIKQSMGGNGAPEPWDEQSHQPPPYRGRERPEEESEVQKFARRWPTILRNSPYRCLVLPPECQRVDKPHRNRRRQEPQKQAKAPPKKKEDHEGTGLDENPGTRLVNYMKQIFHLIVLFRRYDYTAAGRTLITWVQSAIRARNSHKTGMGAVRGMIPMEEEEEEDDDDEEEEDSSSPPSGNPGRGDLEPKKKHPRRSKRKSRRLSRGKTERSRAPRDDAEHGSVGDGPGQASDAGDKPAVPADEDNNNDSSSTRGAGSPASQTPSKNNHNHNDGDSDGDGDNDNEDESSPSSRSTSGSNKSAETVPTRDREQGDKARGRSPALYGDDAFAKTPPRLLLEPPESQPFFTPVQSKTMIPSIRSPPSASIPSFPKRLCHPEQHSLKMKTSPSTIRSRSIATGAKTKDALASYRVETSRRDFRVTSSPGVSEEGGGDDEGESDLPPPSPAQNGGSGAFFFETAACRESIRRMAVEVPVPDHNGYVLGDEFLLDKSFTPLLVFVNSRSGPQQGHLLTTQLRGLLNPIQIWDLADGGPEEILESFSTFSRLRILVCGGDGTVSWIVNTIESMEMKRWPPIAILPLGTGNDLARIHGWGGGYSNEPLVKILEQVSEGYVSWLDRWEMTKENKKGEVKSVQSFLNYLSVGADAQAALQVHMLRESKPQLFFSRIVNKLWYGLFGAEDIIKASSINLRHDITLIADGIEVPLPADSQGIIMLNIDSYTGGVPLWATGDTVLDSDAASVDSEVELARASIKKRSKSFDDVPSVAAAPKSPGAGSRTPSLSRSDSLEELAHLALTDDEKYTRVTACDRPSSCQDGLLDIVSVRGTFHLGQIRVGLSTAQKLCQCREATIVIKRKVAVQIDGEPWRQNTCTLKIRRKKDAAIMLHRSADESNGVETEMGNLLDWAKNKHLIDGRVHRAMMKEFSRRIESKTRQRRIESNDNLMSHLKRAIYNDGGGGGGYHYHPPHAHAGVSSGGGPGGTGISF